MDYREEYKRWLEHVQDAQLHAELLHMGDAECRDAFYRELSFGTGGLRGTLGAGTNRMNTYVVAKASQGLADWLGSGAGVVIGYDSRLKSDLFARTAAAVFAANGLHVYLFEELLPVPTVSYAVRRLGADAGVMITASHNPCQYNGYKVYGADGCQITSDAAAQILREIRKLDVFADVRSADFEAALADGRISLIGEDLLTAYLAEVKAQSVLFGDEADRDVAIVYSPLNGTGLKPVTRVLAESGFTNVTVVAEQAEPDGTFPTCPAPNPEVREAMEIGLQYCGRLNADLLLATDPDCDRCGIAVRDGDVYRLLSGNETGLLLLDYICSQKIKHGAMPPHPVFLKTIVTTQLAEKLAACYGVKTRNVLTGFKYIGEAIGRLEQAGRAGDFVCAFEESYGYLTGPYVRDKDGVDAALMICEMFAVYKRRGLTLPERLRQLYTQFGFCLDTLHSYAFEGPDGMDRMTAIMARFRTGIAELCGQPVVKITDYAPGLDGLPPADVLKLETADLSAVIRPSGTEPKLKLYLSVSAPDPGTARELEAALTKELEALILQKL
ncbi:MAG: phospho-sugar mutase [Oscillospiraceae bacterium]|nr:phospho-sugar mutase [Oscillospiraceae bacterium]